MDRTLDLLELLPVGIFVTDKNGQMTYVNQALVSMVGYPREELIGRSPRIWKSGNHTLGFYKQLWQTILSGRKWDGIIQNKKKDGTIYWQATEIIPLKQGEDLQGFLAVARDVSYEYYQQQQVLDYYEQLYMDVLNHVRVGIAIFSGDRSLMYINPQLKRWLGENGGVEVCAVSLMEVPFVSCCVDKAFCQGQLGEITVELNGGFFRVTTFPMRLDGKVTSVVVVFVDITKEKTVERELALYKEFLEQEIENRTYALTQAKRRLELQAMELTEAHENLKVLYEELKEKNRQLRYLDQLKTEFVFTVSHEIRTPLTTIREGVALILDRVFGEITAEQEDILRTVLADIDRLSRIVSDFLDIAKIESGRLALDKREVDLSELLQGCLKSFVPVAEGKGLELISEVEEGLLSQCDPDRINQVLVNLLGNALKFTEEGFIRVEAKRSEDGRWVQVVVEDTGPGIPDEDKEKVFDKFYQVGRKAGPGPQGTGLGLPISKRLVELHGGQMWVEDRPGGGSRFCFTLPLEEVRSYVQDTGSR